jgi:hypothetical protein
MACKDAEDSLQCLTCLSTSLLFRLADAIAVLIVGIFCLGFQWRAVQLLNCGTACYICSSLLGDKLCGTVNTIAVLSGRQAAFLLLGQAIPSYPV